jgi:hypothetical protein
LGFENRKHRPPWTHSLTPCMKLRCHIYQTLRSFNIISFVF